jgi:hypothetical protein
MPTRKDLRAVTTGSVCALLHVVRRRSRNPALTQEIYYEIKVPSFLITMNEWARVTASNEPM